MFVGDVFGRLRRRGHDGDPIRGMKLVPGALRHDGEHAGLQRQLFLFARRRDQGERGAALQDLNDLIAVGVAFPLAHAGKTAGKDGAIAIFRQPGEGAGGIGKPGPVFKKCQPGQRGLDVDRCGHCALPRLAMATCRQEIDMPR